MIPNNISFTAALALGLFLLPVATLPAKTFSKGGADGSSFATVTARGFTSADFKNSDTEASFSGLALEATRSFPINTTPWRASLAVGLETVDYDLDSLDSWIAGPGALIDDALALRVAPGVAYRYSADTNLFLNLSAQSSAATGADFSDSLTYGFAAGARHVWSPRVAVTFGLSVSSRLEDDAKIVPIIGLEWRITDEWRLDLAGLRGRLSYAFAPGWTVFGEASYENREWRLADDARAPDGVLRHSAVPLSAGLAWAGGPWAVTAMIGAPLTQTYELDNRSGDTLRDTDAEGGLALSLSSRFSF